MDFKVAGSICRCDLEAPGDGDYKGGTKIPCDRRKRSRLRGSDGVARDVNRLVGFERSSFINALMEHRAIRLRPGPEKRVRRCSGDKAPG